jgi:TRAP-type C4-dicarboxylate transport system substrate-binding protein
VIGLRAGGYQGETSVHTAALRALAARLGAAGFAPDLEMDVTAGGGTARALFDGVEAGGREICYLASGYLSARVPALGALDLPYAAPDAARLFAALDGAAGEAIRAAVEGATALRLLGFWDNGLRHVSNGRRPIRRPTDCAGLVIRTLDNTTYQAALAAMGFRPVVTDVLRLRAAVVSGEVDAQENPLTNLLGFRLHGHHRFVSLTGHIQGVVLLVAHRPWFHALPAPARAALAEAAREATLLQRRLAAAEDARAMTELARLGVEVIGPDGLDLPAFRAACAGVAADAAKGLDPALLAALR